MGLTSGLQSQLGIAAEVTYGTRVAAARHHEFVSENMKYHLHRVESQGIRAGRRMLKRWNTGAGWVDGGFTIECAPQGTALLLRNAIGGSIITGAGPYVHTITPSDIDGKSLTIQVQKSDISGTDRVFEYTGMQVTDWSLDCSVGQYLQMTANFYGATETTNQTLTAATYATGIAPFVWSDCSMTIAGSAYDVRKFSLACNNNLATGRHQISATTPGQHKKSKESGLREYGGTIESDFIDLTAYTRFTAGTEAALVFTATRGATSLVATMNVRFDGDTPNINSASDIVGLSLPFKCTSDTSDAAAFTIVVTNQDAAD